MRTSVRAGTLALGTALLCAPGQAAALEPGEPLRDCESCPELVVLPAGRFVMGSPPGEPGRDDDEGPRHEVRIPQPFAIGRTEVTYRAWQACVDAGGCAHEPDDFGWGRGTRPVVGVSWHDVQLYLGWLSRVSRARYRLPSEAEWEYAARAGSEAARFWGPDAGRACLYANVADRSAAREHEDWDIHDCDDGAATTAPVASYRPNDFGLHDMLGNVWEWTLDCRQGGYEGAPADGSAWLTDACEKRVVRGGSWVNRPSGVRAADANRVDAGSRYNLLGFRVVRELP